ncbi:MAG: RNA 2',3'-cyclic phosphodiesterase [Desulfovibrionaceae bacterium]|nr:RNA 2',3'-cyclic phosphodiesterase [Desulfovibrionaceae bacterium]
MARLFIGIALPAAYQERVHPFTQALGNDLASSVNWTRPGNWHLTLKFLGDTDEARIPAIMDALETVDLRAFPLQAGGAGTFPNPQRPKVLWLGLKQGARECEALAQAVEDTLAAIGLSKEKKRFRPHLTLGRVRRDHDDNWQAVLDKAASKDWPAFTVDHFILWQSQLAPTGAVHTAVAQFSLRK